jgi:hypothetical protein
MVSLPIDSFLGARLEQIPNGETNLHYSEHEGLGSKPNKARSSKGRRYGPAMMLRIGEFSRRGRVLVKAVRYY